MYIHYTVHLQAFLNLNELFSFYPLLFIRVAAFLFTFKCKHVNISSPEKIPQTKCDSIVLSLLIPIQKYTSSF